MSDQYVFLETRDPPSGSACSQWCKEPPVVQIIYTDPKYMTRESTVMCTEHAEAWAMKNYCHYLKLALGGLTLG